MVQQRRQVAADQGDEAVAGVLAQLLGRQPGEGRLRQVLPDSSRGASPKLEDYTQGAFQAVAAHEPANRVKGVGMRYVARHATNRHSVPASRR
jgi:hypothetical protein